MFSSLLQLITFVGRTSKEGTLIYSGFRLKLSQYRCL